MKKGISLIVLVITIIVMIILAATVVISLSNTGVIDRASKAVDLTNEASVQDLAVLIWADAYMDDKRGTELASEVTTKLGEQGITSDKWNIEISNTGIIVSKNTGATLISFTIDGITYQAEEGMTWESWANSKYNTAGAVLSSSYIKISGKYLYHDQVTGSERIAGIIKENYVYTLKEKVSPPTRPGPTPG